MAITVDKLYFAAKCLVINEKNEFLILQRTNYKNDGTEGLWDIPGGAIDKHEDITLAMRREMQEETSITLNELEPFHLESGKSNTSDAQFIFALFASRDFDLGEGIILSHEHAEYRWISTSEMEDYEYFVKEKSLALIKKFLSKN